MMPKCLLAAAVLLAGLGCLRPSTPVVLHTLRGLAPRAAEPGTGRGLAVEVLPIGLPEVLQRPQLVLALGPDSLELSPSHRWGNALDKDMQQVVVDNLSQLLGSERVVAFPYGPRVNAALRVEVNVQRCDGRPGGTLVLRATWMITRPKGDQALVLRQATLEVPVRGVDAEALVAAHNEALAALSREIAEALAAHGRGEH